MQLDSTILRRCKQVIEELQADLTRKTVEVKQKEQEIENVLIQRNSIFSKNQQLQQIVYELKEANVIMRGQLKKAESNQLLQKQISRLKKDFQTLAINYENKEIQNRELENRLRQETLNKRDIDHEITSAIKDVTIRIRLLEDQILFKDQQNKRLESIIVDRQCQYCEAISDINNLNHLRKKIDDTIIKSNTKVLSNQNYIKTASSKKSTSLMRQLSDKKNSFSGNIISNNIKPKSRLSQMNLSNYPITISPFRLNEKLNISNEPTRENSKYTQRDSTKENVQKGRRDSYVNQQAVNATLRQIEDKLKKMSQKLEYEESDMSVLSVF